MEKFGAIPDPKSAKKAEAASNMSPADQEKLAARAARFGLNAKA
jgi:hypothetical protein